MSDPVNAVQAMPTEYDDEAARRAHALDPAEKLLCENIAVLGLEYLRLGKGWGIEECRRFINRHEVMAYINYLLSQYKDRGGIQERTQFYAQLKLNSMVPAALSVLARSLAGTQLSADGTQVAVRAPDRGQFDSAIEILSRANIGGKFAGSTSVPLIDARTINIGAEGAVDAVTGLTPKSRSNLVKRLKSITNRLASSDLAAEIVKSRRAERVPVKDDEDAPPPAPVLPVKPQRAVEDEDPRDKG